MKVVEHNFDDFAVFENDWVRISVDNWVRVIVSCGESGIQRRNIVAKVGVSVDDKTANVLVEM